MKLVNVWNAEQLEAQKGRIKDILVCVANLAQGKDVTFDGAQYAPTAENLALFQSKQKGALDLHNKQAKLYKLYTLVNANNIRAWFESPCYETLSISKDGTIKSVQSPVPFSSLLKTGKDNDKPFPHTQAMRDAFKSLHESLVLVARPSNVQSISKNAIKKALTAFFVAAGLFDESRECKAIDAHFAFSSVSGTGKEFCTLKDISVKQVENILVSVYRSHTYGEKYMFESVKKELAMLAKIIEDAQARQAELTK